MASALELAADRLLLGHRGGPVVTVPARVAALLNRHAGLNEYRIRHRGEDAEVDAALLALALAGASWTGSGGGTRVAAPAEPVAQSKWVSTAGAAARLSITDRAVRRAINEGRLKARRDGTAWRIHTTDLEHYRAQRP